MDTINSTKSNNYVEQMEKRNFTKSERNGGKTAEMRNNSAKSRMIGMSDILVSVLVLLEANIIGYWITGDMPGYILTPVHQL